MQKKFLIIGTSIVFAAIAVFLIYRIAINVEHSLRGAEVLMDEEAVLLDRAKKSIAQGELLKARDLYQGIMEKFPTSNNILKTQEALYDVNIKMLFSPIITSDSFSYEVQKGDTLNKIAKKFNSTAELISKANDLKDDIVRLGKPLKISKAKFSIVVDKSQNILTLKSDGNILKTYIISTGKNFSTPIGTFKTTTKVIDPPWYPPGGGVIKTGDPKNVLGSRWIGISHPGYGIHGTTEPGSIGKSVTEGCIRMKNSDVEELYAIVSEGTEVVIVD